MKRTRRSFRPARLSSVYTIGLFGFEEKPPFNLAPRLKERKDRVDLSTPLNFAYSADTIGGNSGSPVVNRNLELVGLNFDSNLQKAFESLLVHRRGRRIACRRRAFSGYSRSVAEGLRCE
jgi:hypothetical protein